MLVLSRRKGEALVIGEDVQLVVQKVSSGRVRLAIEAPSHVRIVRKEVLEADRAAERARKENEKRAHPVASPHRVVEVSPS